MSYTGDDRCAGFAFIPIIIAIVLATSVAGGGYYAYTHFDEQTTKETQVTDGLATTTLPVTVSENTATGTASTSGARAYVPVEERTGTTNEVKDIENVSVDTEIRTSIAQAQETTDQSNLVPCSDLADILQTDEDWINSLHGKYDEYKGDTLAFGEKTMNDFLSVLDDQIAVTTESDEGRSMLRDTKKTMITEWTSKFAEIEGVYDHSKSTYPANGFELTFIDDLGRGNMCDQSVAAQTGELHTKAAKVISSALDNLHEVNVYAIGMLRDQTDRTADEISWKIGAVSSTEIALRDAAASRAALERQLSYRESSYSAANTGMRCETTAEGSIFSKNRTYTSNCVPDTSSAQEKCDAMIAAWAAGGARTSRPTCN